MQPSSTTIFVLDSGQQNKHQALRKLHRTQQTPTMKQTPTTKQTPTIKPHMTHHSESMRCLGHKASKAAKSLVGIWRQAAGWARGLPGCKDWQSSQGDLADSSGTIRWPLETMGPIRVYHCLRAPLGVAHWACRRIPALLVT